MIFLLHKPKNDNEDEEEASQQFFKIKVEEITTGTNKFRVLKISDITVSQRLQMSQNQRQVLQMINACVSHEMRNPINSIFAMNLQIKEQAQEIAEGLRKITQ